MAQRYDELAYTIGKEMVIDPELDFDSEAMRLARSYILLRSPRGTEEATQVIRGFYRGLYEARHQRASS